MHAVVGLLMVWMVSLHTVSADLKMRSDIPVIPYPQIFQDTSGGSTLVLHQPSFSVEVFNSATAEPVSLDDDEFMGELAERYLGVIFSHGDSSVTSVGATESVVLQFRISDLANRDLGPDARNFVDESYVLDVPAHEKNTGRTGPFVIVVSAVTVFGALRGFETFAQLTTASEGAPSLRSLPLHIADFPRYPWRGLMIDTGRHFLKVETIKKMIDAMAIHKMNVLHWHLMDAQSFPVFIPRYPKLSEVGAFHPTKAVYTPADIAEIHQYAYFRGVRLVPEVDVPGHSASWGRGYPEATAKCPKFSKKNINRVSLNIASPDTTELVTGVLEYVAKAFPDPYLHLGGDELEYECWEEDVKISSYLKRNHLDGPTATDRFIDPIVQTLAKLGKTQIMWRERAVADPSDESVKESAIVEVWRSIADLRDVARLGYRNILNSAGWYLDWMTPVGPCDVHQRWLWLDNWREMWMVELDDQLPSDNEYYREAILGGEACIWGEQVDDYSIFPRTWPRAAVVAERLWSPKWANAEDVTGAPKRPTDEWNNMDAMEQRLVHHTCSNLIRRGIPATPLRPGFCDY